MNRIIAAIALLMECGLSYSQSIETGFVKEYNGEKTKTPLAGVELSVSGAPSTISDSQGHYELKFAVLKPGEAIKYNEIYKSGYAIFNKDALDCWRISNSKKPFVIVMCKEEHLRELKKKYYNIIEKSYRDEYLRQVAIVQKAAKSLMEADEKEKKLKKEYEEKLSNINTYVEAFARIDRSEMDSILGKTLQLIEAGRIEEGIKVYEQLQLSRQVQQMMDKLQAGEAMLNAAQNMIDDTIDDLLSLVEKLKKQIGLYEMGGESYEQKRRDTMSTLISVYIKLNTITNSRFNEDLGEWSCRYIKETVRWTLRTPFLRKVARLPSYHGLMDLAEQYNVLAYNNSRLIDSIRYCYKKVLTMEVPEKVRKEAKTKLELTADFFFTTSKGDTLYAKKDTATGGVMIAQKTIYCYNKVTGDLVLPTSVIHEGHKYDITCIGKNAFCNNRHLKTVTLPKNLSILSSEAFYNCDSLQSVKLNSKLKLPSRGNGYAVFPHSTYLIVPDKLDNPEWAMDFVKKRYKNVLSTQYRADSVEDSVEFLPMKQFLMDLQKVKGISKDDKGKYLSIALMLDTVMNIANDNKARQVIYDSVSIKKYVSQFADSMKIVDDKRLYKMLQYYYLNKSENVITNEYLSQIDAMKGEPRFEFKWMAGIIIQALLKNKTVAQSKKYTEEYVRVAIKWGIRNELRQRYDWFGAFQQDKALNTESLRFGKNWLEQISNLRRIRRIISENTFVNNSRKAIGNVSSKAIWLQEQALKLWKEYESATIQMNVRQQQILTNILTSTDSIDDIIAKYHITHDECRQLIHQQDAIVDKLSINKQTDRLNQVISY